MSTDLDGERQRERERIHYRDLAARALSLAATLARALGDKAIETKCLDALDGLDVPDPLGALTSDDFARLSDANLDTFVRLLDEVEIGRITSAEVVAFVRSALDPSRAEVAA